MPRDWYTHQKQTNVPCLPGEIPDESGKLHNPEYLQGQQALAFAKPPFSQERLPSSKNRALSGVIPTLAFTGVSHGNGVTLTFLFWLEELMNMIHVTRLQLPPFPGTRACRSIWL